MKMGFMSAILDFMDFEQVIDTANSLGFASVELACWPQEEPSRKYAGVSHLAVDRLDAERIDYINEYCRQKNVEISALAYYPNTMAEDLEQRAKHIAHLKQVIKAASLLNINLVTTFVGRMPTKNREENFAEFAAVWPPIIAFAKQHGVKIAIENCPMLFTKDEWPGGHNLASSPANWRRMFEIIDSAYFGLNYDPSHFVWQMMDYIAPIYEFKEKIFHVHFKDIKVNWAQLNDVGTMAYPLEYMVPKIPGYGEVDWGAYASALSDIGYKGHGCIEIEDSAFESSPDGVINSLKLSKRYLEQFVI